MGDVEAIPLTASLEQKKGGEKEGQGRLRGNKSFKDGR